MGILSTLGKIAGTYIGGPVGGAIGSAVGGHFDGKREQRAQTRMRDDYFVKLRDNALRGGFHPLEALRAGGGGGYAAVASAVPAIASNDALAGAFQTLEDIQSGEYQRREERRRIEHDVFRIRAEKELAGGAASIVSRTVSSRAPTTFGTEEAIGNPDDPPEKGRRTVTSVAPFGSGWFEHPFYADAGQWEERLGPVGEIIAGFTNPIAGAEYNGLLWRMAKMEGITREQAHERVLANPEKYDELFKKYDLVGYLKFRFGQEHPSGPVTVHKPFNGGNPRARIAPSNRKVN